VAPAAGAAWFFLLRPSALVMQSPAGEYYLPVPRTYFVRETRRIDELTSAGRIETTMLLAGPPTSTPDGFGMVHIPAPPQGRSREDVLAAVLRGSVRGIGGTVQAPRPISYVQHPGLETTFRGRFEGHQARGRVRAYYVGDEIVVLLLLCTGTACERDADLVDHLDRFRFAPSAS